MPPNVPAGSYEVTLSSLLALMPHLDERRVRELYLGGYGSLSATVSTARERFCRKRQHGANMATRRRSLALHPMLLMATFLAPAPTRVLAQFIAPHKVTFASSDPVAAAAFAVRYLGATRLSGKDGKMAEEVVDGKVVEEVADGKVVAVVHGCEQLQDSKKTTHCK